MSIIRLGCRAALVAGAISLSGCAGMPGLGGASGIMTGSLASKPSAPVPSEAAKGEVANAGEAPFAKGNATILLSRELRKKGDAAKAMAELERARKENPQDRELAREVGIAALELGQLDRARKALEVALDPSAPDWHTLSALGTVQATAGNQKEAQEYFRRALRLKPDHQSTLNNLAMSYALDGNLAKAEQTLRSASKGTAAPAKVKENLALVLALSGKFDAAEKMAVGVLPKQEAEANMAYLRSMVKKDGG